ncbi:unnamed protein product [Danaus chrysippus]|uniref:(African queen) hypothetical protein n=1 Tax=Danaus chrysippus TaxID=151541 RepID=A0A8J2QPW3_9NEOP|nr:unnamed protein product [Danaus chrysippus]
MLSGRSIRLIIGSPRRVLDGACRCRVTWGEADVASTCCGTCRGERGGGRERQGRRRSAGVSTPPHQRTPARARTHARHLRSHDARAQTPSPALSWPSLNEHTARQPSRYEFFPLAVVTTVLLSLSFARCSAPTFLKVMVIPVRPVICWLVDLIT